MKKKSPTRRRPPPGLFEAVILASLVTRAAAIECDSNDTAGKVHKAIRKLSKNDGAA